MEETWKRIRFFFYKLNIGQSVRFIPDATSRVDRFLTELRPWRMNVLTQNKALADILYSAAESIRFIVAMAHPIIPDATQRIWEQLGQHGRLGDLQFDELRWGGLRPGTRIKKPEAFFPRVDKTEISERIDAMENEIRNPATAGKPAAADKPAVAPAAAASTAGAAAAPLAAGGKITIDDFAKVELRVGP